ncbi:MAG: flagellin [Acidobacteriaceae bacterium]|jgi:flagellin
MPLTILNNVSDLTAESALSNTQANLQKTLTQLSTGMKINSGSDDAAGLSIASGMNANIAALTQSQQNASNGVGLLQTADGALSQVTTLLNRAVTLATEGSNSGITASQSSALNTEFGSILSEINQIGNTTNFNGQNVFASNAPTTFTSAQGSVATPLATTTALTAGSKTTISDSATGGTFVFTAAAGNTIATLQTAIAGAVTAGTLSAGTALTINASGEASITGAASGINVTSNDASLGAFSAAASASSTNTVFISDGSTANVAANTQITTSISALSSTQLNLNTNNLSSSANAQTALTAINAAITAISAQRGVIGASVNRLTAASSVMGDQVTNLQSATNSIQNADIGATVANMTQYNVLQSTGMAALQQANQAQQAVLKLVQ